MRTFTFEQLIFRTTPQKLTELINTTAKKACEKAEKFHNKRFPQAAVICKN